MNGFPSATCVLPQGTVYFVEDTDVTYIKIKLHGVPTGWHGFHVHKYGDLTEGCTSCCDHYNPFESPHGGPNDCACFRHVGDLGNVYADGNGIVDTILMDPYVRLTGPYSVIGRSIVLHAKADDLGQGGDEESKKTGNAGKRIGCGVIGHSRPATQIPLPTTVPSD